MEKILQRRDGEVLVKWLDWNGPAEWVRLADNPELQSFLTHSRATPDNSEPIVPYEVQALRQAVFEHLAGARYTGDGNMGRQTRISVKVPFPESVFDATFGLIGLRGIPVTAYVSIQDVTKAIGQKWSSRSHPTSTETYVSPNERIHIRYQVPHLVQHSHALCPR